ncbi:SAM-dependent methyltransferase, partial [Mycobacterium avium]|nr:SAM-dependent methyltransferase [Mycobacterium avium]
MTTVVVDNPFFARIWPVVATHETAAVRALRRENVAGLTGRVLEVGAGIGTNFPLYPETVDEVIAVEPEPRLADRARAAA